MTREQILAMTDAEIMEIVRQIRVAYQLKKIPRYATKRNADEHSESVAEHVFALVYLAEFFLPFEDIEKGIDVVKLHRILLYHDLSEIKYGDQPYHLKTAEDTKREREATQEIFSSLPAILQETARRSWEDYESRQSAEAKLAYALDKIEPIFELLDPTNERSMKRLKFSYEAHIGVKMRATERFPVMRKFVEVMTRDMLKRGVFWTGE